MELDLWHFIMPIVKAWKNHVNVPFAKLRQAHKK
ncbi:MAG: hypothetical protein ETSY2_41125 [Candidatus Entotheonella gemina]|uniref:Uncharacterized protein n=1 Tax=Candidatus Entotheonella gemina TaxID=1429439 RepID=W4LN78_9BACT|nr:MAG: hypothetical protein ETSY2_41125 [Candidatus Entotheonella gemina]